MYITQSSDSGNKTQRSLNYVGSRCRACRVMDESQVSATGLRPSLPVCKALPIVIITLTFSNDLRIPSNISIQIFDQLAKVIIP